MAMASILFGCSAKNISKCYVPFQVEHENMQTYFFAADTRDEMQKWLNALSLATILQRDPR
jgi:hypothetical protein